MRTLAIAIIADTRSSYVRGVLRGILRYAREHGPWSLRIAPPEPSPTARLRGRKWDGIIAMSTGPSLVRALARTHLPCVNISHTWSAAPRPSVYSDDVAVGRLGARFLLDLGLRNLGFCGLPGKAHSEERQQGFLEEAAAAGARCTAWEPAASKGPQEGGNPRLALERWLADQPKPLGVMAANDIRARHVITACQRIGIAVPADVAVLGVDNDDMECEFAGLEISSVELATAEIGQEAARMLRGMVAGRPAPQRPRLVPPLRIVARKSTDILAVDDPHVSAALRFIRDHADELIAVKDLLRVVPIGRRTLAARFEKALGHSPATEIRRRRMLRARELLADRRNTVAWVAGQLGFRHPHHFSTAFRLSTGQTPSEYRRRLESA